VKEAGNGSQGLERWGAHCRPACVRASRAQFAAPSPETRSRSKTSRAFVVIITLAVVGLTSCATVSHHQFAEPTNDWQSRSGQLLYRSANTALIGDVFVRFSKSGDFEMNFSKGPVTLLFLRQDAAFAEVRGAMARMSWSGPIDRAPAQLRGWLGLRDKIIQARDRRTIQYAAGDKIFSLRF
jgi:hypothetical protein